MGRRSGGSWRLSGDKVRVWVDVMMMIQRSRLTGRGRPWGIQSRSVARVVDGRVGGKGKGSDGEWDGETEQWTK